MFTAVCSDGLKGIWLTLIWCRGATKAWLSEPDMMGLLNIAGWVCKTRCQNHLRRSHIFDQDMRCLKKKLLDIAKRLRKGLRRLKI